MTYNELRTWLVKDGEPPETVREFGFDRSRLREITPRQQSIYKAAVALVLRHGAADFHNATTLTPDAIAAKGVDDHHVFPQAYLNPPGQEKAYPQELVDCVLNRTPIDAATNRRIGKRAPSDYLGEVRRELNEADPAAFDRLLDSHLLSGEVAASLLKDDYSGYLEAREARIHSEIQKLTQSE